MTLDINIALKCLSIFLVPTRFHFTTLCLQHNVRLLCVLSSPGSFLHIDDLRLGVFAAQYHYSFAIKSRTRLHGSLCCSISACLCIACSVIDRWLEPSHFAVVVGRDITNIRSHVNCANLHPQEASRADISACVNHGESCSFSVGLCFCLSPCSWLW